ncbi:hypothetical protein J0910_29980 [Nocardiopsis sp. CNT-189]|uniref:hypothetical protein n=1 Tax=Nocardiopsis oceanisediminis TaxID=2816862 RepID=UPI003B29BE6C
MGRRPPPRLGPLVAWWSATWPQDQATALSAFGAVMDFIREVRPKFEKIFGQIAEIVSGAVGVIKGVWGKSTADTIMTVVDFLQTVVVANFRGAFQMVAGIVSGAWQMVTGSSPGPCRSSRASSTFSSACSPATGRGCGKASRPSSPDCGPLSSASSTAL